MAEDKQNVELGFLQREVDRLRTIQEARQSEDLRGGSRGGGGDGYDMPDVSERLAKLEGSFGGLKSTVEGLRHSQNMTLGAVLGIGAILATLILYLLTRIDNLPADFERMNQTLSSAITAAKQQTPQIILMPSPTVQPQPTPSPKQP